MFTFGIYDSEKTPIYKRIKIVQQGGGGFPDSLS